MNYFIYELSKSTLILIHLLIVGLETRPHPRLYPLGWISDNSQVHVTKQCKL
jgi:hypothetical protein